MNWNQPYLRIIFRTSFLPVGLFRGNFICKTFLEPRSFWRHVLLEASFLHYSFGSVFFALFFWKDLGRSLVFIIDWRVVTGLNPFCGVNSPGTQKRNYTCIFANCINVTCSEIYYLEVVIWKVFSCKTVFNTPLFQCPSSYGPHFFQPPESGPSCGS